jgi:hypothetical protein
MFVFTVPPDSAERFPVALVEKAFAPYLPENHDGALFLDGEQTWTTMTVHGDDGELINGFSFNRPPSYEGFPGFWDALYTVMRQTRTMCLIAGFGDDASWCVANPDIRDHLPEGFTADFGELKFASSAAELGATAWGD